MNDATIYFGTIKYDNEEVRTVFNTTSDKYNVEIVDDVYYFVTKLNRYEIYDIVEIQNEREMYNPTHSDTGVGVRYWQAREKVRQVFSRINLQMPISII